MNKSILWLSLLALAGCAGTNTRPAAVAADPATEAKIRQAGAEILFWSQAQRDANFPHMEAHFPGHVVKAGGRVHALPAGAALPIADDEVDAFMAAQNVAGLIVLQDGKIRLERYARGYGRDGRWTSFSVAKSFTSTLVGAAIRDGYIKSVEEPVTRYIPDLAGSGYDGVTIAQLLTMTSGVRWNEDYTDPNSDVAQMFAKPTPAGADPTVAYMRTLPRADAPGTKWVYKTGETNLIGTLVQRATGKSLASYLSDKVFKRYGMEQDAFWMVDQAGHEIGGCCLSVSLRDYARMGQFVLDGGKGVVPAGWFATATAAHADIGPPGFGYGYQWWTYPQGRFGAQHFRPGHHDRSRTPHRHRHIERRPRASDRAYSLARFAFTQKLFDAAAEIAASPRPRCRLNRCVRNGRCRSRSPRDPRCAWRRPPAP